ncbi:MAG: rod shape-determining protein RodA [Candidatus Sungbacteria bacterium RIFCSPLOWO2_01_FULL_47_10]|uniref:Rod shape-determining protein RodA n=1 Tax=Candidatus Sungbacteria bacterium RIFCSPLOWO2_01_FULL_47_10 TaxID=1802276 RepID=A0A1G2KY70_9BACT|nr:MAG: rod shape-determining protein RodA [Candidatus Sungbacteria bacterium RIFCSPLOWO2_01_FULL_47_10]
MISSHLKHLDFFLLVPVLFLITIGLVSLWSLSFGSLLLFYKQIIWIAAGSIFFLSAALFDYRIFRNYGGAVLILYAILIAALIALLLFDIQTRGVAGWFRVEGITVQPIEFMKVVLVILLAKYFSKRHIEIYRLKHLIISGLYVLVPAFLVSLQPDLGSALILGMLWLAVTASSGIKLKHFFVLFILFCIISVLGWTTALKPYQKARVVSFLNPYEDPRGAGYNTIQSLIAVGAGGALGKGIGQGSQSHLLFLPEAETDFIFAAFAEEWGFLGGLFLLALYAVFLLRLLAIGREAEDNFGKLFVIGFTTLIFSQMLVHIGANTGIFPITGITLPFVSYGGSSLVTLMTGMGIVESIRLNSRKGI